MKNFCRFFPFYGAKHRAIGSYNPPKYTTIVEPFAGSAAYATRYYWLDCVLCDVDPVIYAVWDYLIRATSEEIRNLKADVWDVSELGSVPQEAKWLVGFWLTQGRAKPGTSGSAFTLARPDTAWSVRTRDRTAEQASKIKHWKVYNVPYWELPNAVASWFIDPPYSTKAGRHYTFNSINYEHLALWSKEREGQVTVCEQHGANWLPFEYLGQFRSANKRRDNFRKPDTSHEVIYEQG